MEKFIRRENLIIFKRRLAEAKTDTQRQMLLKLLAEEEARVTRGYSRLLELAAGEHSIVDYPLPEVISRWRETVTEGEAVADRRS